MKESDEKRKQDVTLSESVISTTRGKGPHPATAYEVPVPDGMCGRSLYSIECPVCAQSTLRAKSYFGEAMTCRCPSCLVLLKVEPCK